MFRKISLFAVALLALIAAVVYAADLYNNIGVATAIPPITVSNNDNTDSSVVDGLGFGSITYVIETATLADSDVTLTPHVFHCALDNCADAVEVTSTTGLIGTTAGATFAATDDNKVKLIGYQPSKRYSKIRITPANNTGNATFGAVAIKGHPQYLPVSH